MFCNTIPIFCFPSLFLFHLSNQTFPMCPLELTKCSQQNPKYLKPFLWSFPFTSWSPETHSPLLHCFPCRPLKWKLFFPKTLCTTGARGGGQAFIPTTLTKLLLLRSPVANMLANPMFTSGSFLFFWPLNVAVPKVSPQIFPLFLLTTLDIWPGAVA